MSTAPARIVPEVYTWSFPGSPLQIRMQLSVVHEMGRRLGQMAGANGKTRLEGGLLLGRKPRPGISQVTGFCPLPELDTGSIEQAVAESVDQVIGFYRPTSSGNLNLSTSDTNLAKGFFAEPGSIVLLIEMEGSAARKAVFAFWDQGAVVEFPLMEFPFNGHQLAVAETERHTRQKNPLETPTAMDLPTTTAALPAFLELKLRRVSLVLMLVVAVSVGYFWFHSRGATRVILHSPTPAGTAGIPAKALGLAAERYGSDVLLSWDTSSPTIANASFGMLLIRGDGGDRQIALSAEELHDGKMLCMLTSEESEIQLNVIDRDKVSRESVVVALARKPAERVISAAKPRVAKERSAPDTSDTTPSQPSSGHQPWKAFTRPAGSRPVARVASIGEPPPVAWSPSAAGAADTLSSTVPTPSFPAPPSPAPSSKPPAPAKSAEPRSALTARGPVPLQQPVPKITDQIKAVLPRAVSVQLKLSIDAKGHVAKTEPVLARGVNPLLLEAAMEAARFWTFQPAVRDNQPVPGEMVVTFHFAAAH